MLGPGVLHPPTCWNGLRGSYTLGAWAAPLGAYVQLGWAGLDWTGLGGAGLHWAWTPAASEHPVSSSALELS